MSRRLEDNTTREVHLDRWTMTWVAITLSRRRRRRTLRETRKRRDRSSIRMVDRRESTRFSRRVESGRRTRQEDRWDRGTSKRVPVGQASLEVLVDRAIRSRAGDRTSSSRDSRTSAAQPTTREGYNKATRESAFYGRRLLPPGLDADIAHDAEGPEPPEGKKPVGMVYTIVQVMAGMAIGIFDKKMPFNKSVVEEERWTVPVVQFGHINDRAERRFFVGEAYRVFRYVGINEGSIKMNDEMDITMGMSIERCFDPVTKRLIPYGLVTQCELARPSVYKTPGGNDGTCAQFQDSGRRHHEVRFMGSGHSGCSLG